MTKEKIQAKFRFDMECLVTKSLGWILYGEGQPVTDAQFWDEAGKITDEALDCLLALKE